MQSSRLFLSIFIAVIGLGFARPAWGLKATAVGVAVVSQPSDSAYTAKTAWGYGALLELGMGPLFGLEFGALKLSRKYERSILSPAGTEITEQDMLQVPLVFRAYLGGIFSLGAGAYYAKYSGDVVRETQAAGTSTVSNLSYGDAGRETSDFGFVSSLAIYVPLAPLTRFVIDGRYTIGAKDNDTGTGDLKFNDVQVLGGLQFGF